MKEKDNKRPFDQEELTEEQKAMVVGGVVVLEDENIFFNRAHYNESNFNTVNFNTANFNTVNFNTVNFNTSNFNTANFNASFINPEA